MSLKKLLFCFHSFFLLTTNTWSSNLNKNKDNSLGIVNSIVSKNEVVNPTVTITGLNGPYTNQAFTATFTFSENIKNFNLNDITLVNASASVFNKITDSKYTALITPAIMHRDTQGAPSSTDLSTTVKYNTVQAGMNYRVDEMYSVFGLLNIFDNVLLGASYDFTTSKINQINDNGSIEVVIKYIF